MSSLLSSIGLRAAGSLGSSTSSVPNYGPAFLMFHFIYAYGILSSRTLKQFYGLDHNESPREDLAKYGEAAVREGKITQKQLNMLKRNEAASANSVENYTLFVGSVLFASHAGVPNQTINAAALTYTFARLCYGAIYILVEHRQWSQLRGITWWIGNTSCLFLLWKSLGKLTA